MQVPILFNLSDHQLLDLAQQLTPKAVNAGEVVIKEGDEGDSFYIIEEGTFSCYLNDGTKLALIDRGSCFGSSRFCITTNASATLLRRRLVVRCSLLSGFLLYIGRCQLH